MTNKKLPIIGERYRSKLVNHIEVKIEEIYNERVYYEMNDPINTINTLSCCCKLSNFFDSFEPLPSPKKQEQMAISKKEATIEFDVAKMVVAKEELRADLQEWEDDCLIFTNPSRKPLNREGVLTTFSLTKKLIAILDSIKEPKEEDLYACDSCQEMKDDVILHDTPAGEGYFCDHCLTGESNKKVDIWKDVSKLWNRGGFDNKHLILKMEDGTYNIGQGVKNDILPIDSNTFLYYELKEACTLTDFINQQEQTTKKVAELELIIKGLVK